jgi:hypothetical protein
MPYANEHAARLKDPDKYPKFARENNFFYDKSKKEDDKGADVILGIYKKNGETVSEIQAIRFRTEFFTEKRARSWLSEHNFKPILFEPAENKKGGKKEAKTEGDFKLMGDEDKNKNNGNEYDKGYTDGYEKAKAEFMARIEAVTPYYANENYPKAINPMVLDVLKGTMHVDGFKGAIAMVDMQKAIAEEKKAEESSEKIDETPPKQEETASTDGQVRNITDYTAAVKKMKGGA